MPLSHMISLSILNPHHRLHLRTPSLQNARGPVDLSTINEGFGLPSAEDADPFGVLALQQAGLDIKEAGTQQRASSDAFEYRPSPTSPVFRLSLQSCDGTPKRASRRESRRSLVSVDQGTQTADLPGSPMSEASPRRSRDSNACGAEARITTPEPIYHSPAFDHDRPEERRRSVSGAHLVASPETAEPREGFPQEAPSSSLETDVPIAVVAEAVQPPIVAKAKLITIRPRAAPVLPSRNPMRAVRLRALQADISEDGKSDGDSSSTYSVSPTRSGFDEDSPKPWSEQTSIVGDAESFRAEGDEVSRQGSLDGHTLNASPRWGSRDESWSKSPTASLGIPKMSLEFAVPSSELGGDDDEFHSFTSPVVTPMAVN